MDNALQSILELSRDPVFGLSGGEIRIMNAAARQVFPDRRIGDKAVDFLPETLIFEPADSFFSSAVIRGVRYTVSAQRNNGLLFLSLAEEPPAEDLRGYFSDNLLSGMLSELFNIGLSAERLRVNPDQGEAERRKYFGTLYHNYYALYRHLENINTLCTLGEGSMGILLRHVDLVCLCRELVDSLSVMLGEDCAKVEFDTELETLPACVDTPKVERLILNLLCNALKHTPAGGTVRLGLSKSSSNALISVVDNGDGIPPEQLKSVFQSFRNRLDKRTLSDETGAGLGLGLCSQIAEKHGGTLILESRAGGGTSVRVLLPLDPPGSGSLLAEPPDYPGSGMTMLLTELSDVLDTAAYADGFPD